MTTASTETASPERTLIVTWPDGLGNRLRGLLSGMVMAEASHRRFSFLWARTDACMASFHDLFENDWPIQEVNPEVINALPVCLKVPDVLTAVEANLTIRTPHWLLAPGCHPAHAAYIPHCAALLAELRPAPAIARQVAEFQADHFRPRMIGVHLRRGDFTTVRRLQAANLGSSLRAVDRLLERWPDAGVLLCSDDGAPGSGNQALPLTGVQAAYRQRYGARVCIRQPSTLDRRTTAAMQEAVVDLWLLRSTAAFVGTLTSSFSEVAAFGRQTPIYWAGPDSRRYRLLAWLLTQTGIARALEHDGCRRRGRDVILLESIRFYLHRARAGLKRRLPRTRHATTSRRNSA